MPRKKLSSEEFKDTISAERAKLKAVPATKRVMVSVSGGSGSAVAWYRALQWWGKDRVVPVFADTCSEDEDLYRFLVDCEQAFGQTITRLKQFNDDGSDMDIWDCFDRHGIAQIPKAGNACKASVELKQKPLDAFAGSNELNVIAVGYSITESERMLSLNKAKKQTVVYPLVAKPVLGECEIHEELRRIGIEPPRVYQDGFVHNNCLGAGGCILSGLAQYAAVRRLKPEAFRYAKQRSQAFYEKTGFSVLRDQRNGEVKPYTLEELDQEAQQGRDFGNAWQSNCTCMSPMLFSLDEITPEEVEINEAK